MAVGFDCRGDFDKALCHYGKALDHLLISVGEENHPDIASTYNNIGMIHFQQKDYEKALEYFEKTRKIEEHLLDQNHSSLATTYSNLGMVSTAQRRLKQAMKYHRHALTIRQRALCIQEISLPPNHPSIASTKEHLGDVYFRIR